VDRELIEDKWEKIFSMGLGPECQFVLLFWNLNGRVAEGPDLLQPSDCAVPAVTGTVVLPASLMDACTLIMQTCSLLDRTVAPRIIALKCSSPAERITHFSSGSGAVFNTPSLHVFEPHAHPSRLSGLRFHRFLFVLELSINRVQQLAQARPRSTLSAINACFILDDVFSTM